MGDLNESIDFAHRSLALARKIEDRRIVGEQLISLSLAHRDLKNLTKAKEYCCQAIDCFSEIGLKVFEDKSRQLFEELKAFN